MDSQALFKAKTELSVFLRENPHMREAQEKISLVLKHAVTHNNRKTLLLWMISDNLNELSKAWKSLEKIIK